MDIPEIYASMFDVIDEKDRRVFEEEPDTTSFKRPYIPGELWPIIKEVEDEARVYIRVIRFGKHDFIRELIQTETPLFTEEERAHAKNQVRRDAARQNPKIN